MPIPKQRHTKSRRNKRRMHIHLEEKVLIKCSKCGKPVLPHTVCKNCGFYKDKEIINVLGKLNKKERQKKEKEMKDDSKKEKGLSMENLSQK